MALLSSFRGRREHRTSSPVDLYRGASNEKPNTVTPPIINSNDDEFDDDETEYLDGVRLYILMAALTLSIFLMTLNASIIATALPFITTSFNTISDIGWYSSSYLLATCSLGPMSGKLYTHFHLKYTFIVFLIIFELGSLISALSHSSSLFIISRAIGGIGASGLYSGAITILTTSVTRKRRPVLIGIATSFAGVSQLAGPIVGGAITEKLNWRWCFWIDLPPGGAVIALLLFLSFPAGPRKPFRKRTVLGIADQLDFVGFFLFAGSIVMILLATQWGGFVHAWNSAMIVGLFCGSAAVMALFVAWERFKGPDAMVPLAIFKNNIVTASCMTAFLQFGSLLLITIYLPLWFQVVKRKSPLQSGIATLPTMIAQFLAAGTGGKLIAVMGVAAPLAVFGSICATIGSGLMTTFVVSTGAGKWIGYQVLTGYGRGIVFLAPVTAIQSVLTQEQMPTGSAMVVFSQYFGGALFTSLGQTLFVSRLSDILKSMIPGFNVDLILHAGATSSLQIPIPFWRIILIAYNDALTQTFYLAAAGSALAVISSAGLGYKKRQANASVTAKVVEETSLVGAGHEFNGIAKQDKERETKETIASVGSGSSGSLRTVQ